MVEIGWRWNRAGRFVACVGFGDGLVPYDIQEVLHALAFLRARVGLARLGVAVSSLDDYASRMLDTPDLKWLDVVRYRERDADGSRTAAEKRDAIMLASEQPDLVLVFLARKYGPAGNDLDAEDYADELKRSRVAYHLVREGLQRNVSALVHWPGASRRDHGEAMQDGEGAYTPGLRGDWTLYVCKRELRRCATRDALTDLVNSYYALVGE